MAGLVYSIMCQLRPDAKEGDEERMKFLEKQIKRFGGAGQGGVVNAIRHCIDVAMDLEKAHK